MTLTPKKERYINPYTDFGFKKLFGEELNKDLVIDFLNQVLKEEEGTITDITYLTPERMGTTAFQRRAVFDLYCQNDKGEYFIVEMQKAKQDFFKDRSIFYSTFPIQQQAEQGADWNFKLKAVYTIGILDFIFNEDKHEPDKLLYKVKLSDIETNKVFYDKLTFVYIEMPKFKKTEDELKTKFDKWLYVLKNLPYLESYPAKLRDRIFKKVFEVSEIAAFTNEERLAYEDSIKVYRDFKNVVDTARSEGRIEGEDIGLKKGRIEGEKTKALSIAKNLKNKGFSVPDIKDATGLSLLEINEL